MRGTQRKSFLRDVPFPSVILSWDAATAPSSGLHGTLPFPHDNVYLSGPIWSEFVFLTFQGSVLLSSGGVCRVSGCAALLSTVAPVLVHLLACNRGSVSIY